MLALERDHPDKAVTLLEESLQMAQSHGVPFRARILHRLAQALSKRRNHSDIERAKELLQQAMSLLNQMGDTRKAKQLREELGSLG